MINRIEISPKISDWILSIVDKTAKNEKVLNAVASWSNGENYPTFNQLKDISRALHIPFGYFLLKNPPKEDLSLLEFRTFNSRQQVKASRELVDTMTKMEQIQDWAKTERAANGMTPLQFVGSEQNEHDPDKLAERIRQLLHLKTDWFCDPTINTKTSFSFLRNALSNLGVIIMVNSIVGNNTRRSLDIEEFRAFALTDHLAPLIFINSNDANGGLLFSLVHEFVHILMGTADLYNNPNVSGVKKQPRSVEQLANAATAELLVPQRLFIEKWHETNDESSVKIDSLSTFFKCSRMVIARRALDFDYIQQELYIQIEKQSRSDYLKLKEKNKNNKKGPSFYNMKAYRFDNNLFQTMEQSIAEGRTTYTQAYSLTDTAYKNFDQVSNTIKRKHYG